MHRRSKFTGACTSPTMASFTRQKGKDAFQHITTKVFATCKSLMLRNFFASKNMPAYLKYHLISSSSAANNFKHDDGPAGDHLIVPHRLYSYMLTACNQSK